jgi:hypothetical protein
MIMSIFMKRPPSCGTPRSDRRIIAAIGALAGVLLGASPSVMHGSRADAQTARAGAGRRADPERVRFIASDIANFWRAYDALAAAGTLRDSARAFADGYYAPATPGLAEFARARIGTPEFLLHVVARRRRYYESIRENTLRLASLEPELRRQLAAFDALHPGATFPDVTFVIGSFRSAGIAAPGGLYIGVEFRTRSPGSPLDELTAWERANVETTDDLPCIVLHELAHYQQREPTSRTLLALSLYEGGAEFVASLVCGRVKRALHDWGDRNERAVWRAFAQQMDSTRLGLWLYNGGRITDRPADLGYYVGFRIAEAYHRRARDKRAAVREILRARDPRGLLRESGYGERFGGAVPRRSRGTGAGG